MKTLVRMMLAGGVAAALEGTAGADTRGLVEIDHRPYYDMPTVRIWTDCDFYRVGEFVRITVTVDRPAYVTVYNIDAAGRVRRLTRAPEGAWAAPGRPLYLPERAHARLVATGPGGPEELVAVASPTPMRRGFLPFYMDCADDDLPVCGPDPDDYIARLNVRLAGGLACDRSVARSTFWVEPVRRYRYPVQLQGGVTIDVGFHIPLGARVYVDGTYCGVGPQALWAITPGWHRVTVSTAEGKKFSRKVKVDGGARWHRQIVPAGKEAHAPRRDKRG